MWLGPFPPFETNWSDNGWSWPPQRYRAMNPQIIERLNAALRGRYRVDSELGAGGMATVYLAQDLRHDRRVALKLLRPEFATAVGAERFLAEIRVTASLQHPHILPLFDSGESDGALFYVMPLVEDESLRERLRRERQLPVDVAVRLAVEVASALDYAHRHGVVHRDIKPENVMLHEGAALVADFGIALAAAHLTHERLTATGISVGTPTYMSPEQAMGDREVDARSDIYALGATLYEMLVGEPPFLAGTSQAVVAKVLTQTPVPVSVHRDTVPDNIAAAVQRALSRVPADRFATAEAFARALTTPESAMHATATRALRLRFASPTSWRRLAPIVAAATVLGALLGAAVLGREPNGAPRKGHSVVHLPVPLPDSAPLGGAYGPTMAMTPDGSGLIYLGFSHDTMALYFLPLDKPDPILLPGTAKARQPFISPDGRQLGFVQDGRLLRTPLVGGAVTVICELPPSPQGATWLAGDTVLVAGDSVLLEVPASGGTPRVVARAEAGEQFRFPDALPGGRGVVFGLYSSKAATEQTVHLASFDRRTGRLRRYEQVGGSPRWVDGGHLVLADPNGALRAVDFDLDRMEVTSEPIEIVNGLHISRDGDVGAGISRAGDIAYEAAWSQRQHILLRHRNGQVGDSLTVLGAVYGLAFSPEGRRLAFTRGPKASSVVGYDVWVHDLKQQTRTRITFDSVVFPWTIQWSSDGRAIVYSSWVDTASFSARLVIAPVDASGPATVQPPTGSMARALRYEPATQTLFYIGRQRREDEMEVWRTQIGGDSPPERLFSSPRGVRSAAISADGAWIAYETEESARWEVYLRSTKPGSGRIQVSREGGRFPRWSQDGRELFFTTTSGLLMATTIRTSPSLAVSAPKSVMLVGDIYDVSPDGAYVASVRWDPGGAVSRLYLLLNWFEGHRNGAGT